MTAVTSRFAPPGQGSPLDAAVGMLCAGTSAGAHRSTATWAVLPGSGDPRFLLPVRPRRAAAAALRDYARHARRSDRWKATVGAVALRAGLTPLLFRADQRIATDAGDYAALCAYLGTIVEQEVSLAVHLGPPRPNRKPVLFLLSADGRLAGIAKVGVDPLTEALVRNEYAALTTVCTAQPTGVRLPLGLHLGCWRDLALHVQSALPLRGATLALPTHVILEPARHIAHCLGTTRGPFAGSTWWISLRQRLSTAAACSTRTRLMTLLDAVAAQRGGDAVTFGSSHGDLTPWNSAVHANRLLVWDWERFATGVPIGFDALHYDIQSAVRGSQYPAAIVATTMRRAPILLTAMGVPIDDQDTTTILYAAELTSRYLTDGHHQNPRSAALTSALLDAADTSLAARR